MGKSPSLISTALYNATNFLLQTLTSLLALLTPRSTSLGRF